MEKVAFNYENHATLPEIASMVANAFPELERRAIPVMGEDTPEDEKQAIKLPYCLIGLREGRGIDNPKLGASTSAIKLRDDLIIEFAFAAEKWKRPKTEGGGETPLWKYYDFETIRDTLFEAMIDYGSDRALDFQYISVDVSTDRSAVYIEFRFSQAYEWCRKAREPDTESPDFVYCIKGA